MSLFDGVTAMRAQGGTPVLIAEREAQDTPTMLRVSIEQRRVVEDRRQEGRDVSKEQARKRVSMDEVLQLIIDEGLTQAEAERRLGMRPRAASNHIQRALEAGEIERVGYGMYRRAKREGQQVEQAQRTGLTEAQVREIAGQVVSEAVKKTFQTSLSQLEGWIERAVRDQVSAIRKDVDELGRRTERTINALANEGKRSGALEDSVQRLLEHSVTTDQRLSDLRERADKLGSMLATLTHLSAAVSALEAYIEDLRKAGPATTPPPTSDVAELALRIIAAERGLTT